MKKIILTLAIICMVLIMILVSCDQYNTRNFGGTTIINLEPGEKLIEATWKDNDLWYLVEPMDSDYVPKIKTFKESSTMGIMEGEVTFIESR